MTVTETEASSQTASEGSLLAPPRPPSGLAAVFGTSDHKTLGRLWIVTACVHLLVAAVAGIGLGAERLDVSSIDVIDADVFAQAYSLHAVAATFLFLLPLLIGLATVVVPLQVGSRAIAFPRAAAAAYWTYLIAGGVVLASFAADGGPFGADGEAVELFLASFIAVLVALTLAAVTVATTGVALRAPGMGLHRVPLFTWANVVTGILVVLTLPVLVGVMILVFVDHRYGSLLLGGADGILLRIAWAWSQPSVFVFAVPALGFVADVVPVAAQTRLTLHKVAMGCIGAFGVFAFGAWAMPGFSADAAPALAYYGEVPFYAFSGLVVLPVLVLAGLLADTLRRGSVRLISPLLWGIGALLLVLDGAVTGLAVAVDPFDLIGTTGTTAQMHSVLGAAMLALLGGLAYWAPKVLGSSLAEMPSRLLALLGLVGVALLAVPDLVSGFLDQASQFGAVASETDGIEALNVLSLGGGILTTLAVVAFLLLVLRAAVSSVEAGDDPWNGHTLEWATSSPPQPHNFSALPSISSEAPLYDARHRQEEGA